MVVDIDVDVSADVCVRVNAVCDMTNRCANIAPSLLHTTIWVMKANVNESKVYLDQNKLLIHLNQLLFWLNQILKMRMITVSCGIV